MSGLCTVHVTVWIIFGYYVDKYLYGYKKMKELTIQQTWIPIWTVHIIHAHTFYFI